MGCGALGMMVATYSNYRTAIKARTSLADAFRVAYQAGCVMGFALVSFGLMMLTLVIIIFKSIKTDADGFYNIQQLFESVAGYGLGGSTVALFARVGGGIYTKAADVGADLVGKI
jgi:Na+/H+-translocating membrane pyrophosphatase